MTGEEHSLYQLIDEWVVQLIEMGQELHLRLFWVTFINRKWFLFLFKMIKILLIPSSPESEISL